MRSFLISLRCSLGFDIAYLTFSVSVPIAVVGENEAFPLDIGLLGSYELLAKDDQFLSCVLLYWFPHICRNVCYILGPKEKGAAKALNTNVENSMYSCLQLVVCDALDDSSQVYN